MSQESEMDTLWEMIKPIKHGMLSTYHDGKIHSRPMALVQDDFDGRLFFFTQDDSLKVAEISSENSVGISFSSTKDQAYISVSGNARLTRNKELIEKLWNPFVESYFPEGKNDEHLAILEVDVESAECWKVDENRIVQAFKLAKSYFKKQPPNIGEHRQFN